MTLEAYSLKLVQLMITFCFAGEGGWAAPRLKDAALSLDKLQECYVEVIMCFYFYLGYLMLVPMRKYDGNITSDVDMLVSDGPSTVQTK